MDRSRGPGTDPSTVAGKAESNIGGGQASARREWNSPLAPATKDVMQRVSFNSDVKLFPFAEDENYIYRATGDPLNFFEVGVKGDNGEIEAVGVPDVDITSTGGDVPTESPGLAAEGGTAYMAAGRGDPDNVGSVYSMTPNLNSDPSTLNYLGEIDISTNSYGYYTQSVIIGDILYVMGDYWAAVKGFDVETGTEVAVPDAPIPIGSGGAVKIGDSFYVHDADNASVTTMLRYDTGTESWTQLADTEGLNSSYPGEAPLAYDGEDSLYMCGGYTFVDKLLKYSIPEDVWSVVEVDTGNFNQNNPGDQSTAAAFGHGPYLSRHYVRGGEEVLEFWGSESGISYPGVPIEVVL